MTRVAVIDEILERCPQAEAAFQAWADSDDSNIRNGSAAIIGAVSAAALAAAKEEKAYGKA
jgi:hypothetical protein